MVGQRGLLQGAGLRRCQGLARRVVSGVEGSPRGSLRGRVVGPQEPQRRPFHQLTRRPPPEHRSARQSCFGARWAHCGRRQWSVPAPSAIQQALSRHLGLGKVRSSAPPIPISIPPSLAQNRPLACSWCFDGPCSCAVFFARAPAVASQEESSLVSCTTSV